MNLLFYKYFVYALICMAFFVVLGFGATHSFFSDAAASSNNIFSAASVFPTISPSVTPTPTSTSSAQLVINEVYYDPDSEHSVGGTNADNDSEWIEIYNPTSSTVNLQNWKITDNSGTERTVSTSNRNIGPGEFVIFAKAANVRILWGIDESIFVPIGEEFGDGLANGGDRVVLKNSTGSIIDQMSYGTDSSILNPSAIDAADGHSLERDPDGVDTNTATDFVDRTTPTPGT